MKWEDTLIPALEELRKRLEAGEHMVKVGLPDDPALDTDGRETEITLGEAARHNEFGTETVPERPAWRLALSRGQKDFNRLNKVNLGKIARGEMSFDMALGQLGAMGVAKVKLEILDGDFVPNAPSTIARKGSSHPLINTAQTRQSVTWEVVR